MSYIGGGFGTCSNCGNTQPQSEMPDWSICQGCHALAVAEHFPEGSYTDRLGIVWTPEDIDNMGGINEIEKEHDEREKRSIKPYGTNNRNTT